MEYINLTQHAITLGDTVVQPSGHIVQVTMQEEVIGMVGDMPAITRRPDHLGGLPDPEEGKVYVVSSMVLDQVPSNRLDVIAPDTGSTAIRNEKGHVLAATRVVVKSHLVDDDENELIRLVLLRLQYEWVEGSENNPPPGRAQALAMIELIRSRS